MTGLGPAPYLLPPVCAYTLAVLGCWLFVTARQEGVVYGPRRLLAVYRPLILAFAAGFFPAAILVAILIPLLQDRLWIVFLVFAAGLATTGLLAHRDLMRKTARPRACNIVIALAVAAATLGSAWLAFAVAAPQQ